MSIGPSQRARDRTQTKPTESPTQATSFALRHAKRSFEPSNTDPCPRMFADKWAAAE